MPEPRVYVAGLPVWIRVHDDGTVETAVDLGDFEDGVRENELGLDDIDDAGFEADIAAVEAVRAAREGREPTWHREN